MNITNTFEHSGIVEKYCNILNTMTDDYGMRNYDVEEIENGLDNKYNYNYDENHPLDDWHNSEYKLEDENVFGVDEVYIKENTDKNEYLLIDDVEKVGLNRYIGVIKSGNHIEAMGVIYKKTNNGIEILSSFNRVDNQIYITDNINYNKLFKKENNTYYTEDLTRKCELIVERDHTKQDVKYGIIQTNSEKIEILFKYTDYGIYITEYNATYNKMIDDNKIKRYNLFKDSHKIVHILKNVLNNDVKDVTIDDYDIIVENPNVTYISTYAPIKYKISVELDRDLLNKTIIDIYCMYNKEEVENNITDYVIESMRDGGMNVEDIMDMKNTVLQRTGEYKVCVNKTIYGDVDSSPFENADISIESSNTLEEDIDIIVEEINNYI